MTFFVSKSRINNSIYHLIHEFSDLEEIKESFSVIFSNVRMLRFIADYSSSHKNTFFGIIDCLEKGELYAKDIKLSTDLKIIDSNIYLFKKISSKIAVKILIKVEL